MKKRERDRYEKLQLPKDINLAPPSLLIRHLKDGYKYAALQISFHFALDNRTYEFHPQSQYQN